MVKTQREIETELKRVRAALARIRSEEQDGSMMYGAQQALAWALGTGMAPSKLERVIERLARMADANG